MEIAGEKYGYQEAFGKKCDYQKRDADGNNLQNKNFPAKEHQSRAGKSGHRGRAYGFVRRIPGTGTFFMVCGKEGLRNWKHNRGTSNQEKEGILLSRKRYRAGVTEGEQK